MSITNPWLTPYQRSYQQIKSKLISSLQSLKDKKGNQLITDFSEGNILIILISLIAAVAEVIHSYIDNMAREAFLTTARRYDSLVKHAALVDYHPRGAIAATVDVVLTRPLDSNTSAITINKGTEFIDNNGNKWLSTKDVIMPINVTMVKVPLIQHEPHFNNGLLGIIIPTNSEDTQVRIILGGIPSGKFYEEGTLSSMVIGEDTWTLVKTFAYSKPSDKHYMVVNNPDNGQVEVVFGNGVHGQLPEAGKQITEAYYYITTGTGGNISSGSIQTPGNLSQQNVSCSNPYRGSGGSNYETFTKLKRNIPLSVKTLGVAVTKQDFIDLALQVDGVGQAALEYECGRKLNVYITGDNGVTASQALLDRVYEELKQHSPLTTWLRVKSVGEVQIILDIEVTGKKSFKSEEIRSQILNALYQAYPITGPIGGKVRISDLYALIDNLPSVDYLKIKKFYTKPWPTIIYGNKSLIISDYTLIKAVGSASYLINFTSSTTYNLIPYNNPTTVSGTGQDTKITNIQLEGTVGKSLTVSNGNFEFTLNIGDNGYTQGDKYKLTVVEPNLDYEDPGYNVPTFTNSTNLLLDINEVL